MLNCDSKTVCKLLCLSDCEAMFMSYCLYSAGLLFASFQKIFGFKETNCMFCKVLGLFSSKANLFIFFEFAEFLLNI